MTMIEQELKDKWGPIAMKILADWKADQVALREKYGNFGTFIIRREAEALWECEHIRAEFGNDISVLLAYLENGHRTKSYGG